MRTILIASVCLSLFCLPAHGQLFGPLPYLQATDVPDGFCVECELEDFEDNEINSFLTFDCGEILGPNIDDPRIPGVQITDSVDGDDGTLDGNGNSGHSYFCTDPATAITVDFGTPVAAAGAVWTDGDRGVSVQIEAFDVEGSSIAISEPAAIADSSFFGETAEDHFFGVRSDQGIASMTIRTLGAGAGIEIDHVRWDSQELVVTPDPPTIAEICDAIAAQSIDLRFDLNSDGAISADDVNFALTAMGTVAGDINLDGSVGFDDFLTLSGSFGQSGLGYAGGDLDCDGDVAFSDFLLLSGNFGIGPDSGGAAVSSVPEPESWMSATMAILATAAFRRRRKR